MSQAGDLRRVQVETERQGRPDGESEEGPGRHLGMEVEAGRSGWET